MNVIEVNNVSKRFLLGSTSVRGLIQERKERRENGASGREFWALHDISFRVPRGAALGIVGHNGSGKSTMLKLLTGILEPTKGAITTRGRIGALIEVGAGFHPELTGRENVFLNGSILGLSEREIAKRFDEIVEFAGLEQFIDTPVKRYSSGMYMRLGFSIAANVNPDILIVDEVLAVGDTLFQNKCMKKMREFVGQGGTIVFVSHAMPHVERLCDQCVWLDHGQILYHGETRKAVERYMAMVADREDEEFKRKHPKEWEIVQDERRRAAQDATWARPETSWDMSEAPGNEMARLTAVRVRDGKSGQVSACVDLSDPLTLEMDFCVLRGGSRYLPVFHVYNEQGVCMFTTPARTSDPAWDGRVYGPGLYRARWTLPGTLLNYGRYHAHAILVQDKSALLAHVPGAVSVYVRDDGAGRDGFDGEWIGVIRPLEPWQFETINPAEATTGATIGKGKPQ